MRRSFDREFLREEASGETGVERGSGRASTFGAEEEEVEWRASEGFCGGVEWDSAFAEEAPGEEDRERDRAEEANVEKFF